MIKVTRLDQSQLYLNAEFIQSVESTPDTHIVLANGHSYVVRESDDEIIALIVDYRRLVSSPDAGSGRAALHLVSNE